MPHEDERDAATGAPPCADGDRLGVVVGSSLLASPIGVGRPRRVQVDGRVAPCDVELADHGDFVVLLRHGPDGRTPAHLVDHHAHVRALVAAGCDRVLAIGSSGSLRRDWPVGTVVAPDDLLALSSYETFHDTTDGYGMRGIDPTWQAELVASWPAAGRPLRDGGTYAQVRGPRFETAAEIRLLATFADLVGMTLAAECILASEAGLRHAAVCQVDNLANGVGSRRSRTTQDATTAADGASAHRAYLDNTRTLHETFAAELVELVHTLVAAPLAADRAPVPAGAIPD
jgi:purine nucleoside phosphorylase